jgi:hypothetical protein
MKITASSYIAKFSEIQKMSRVEKTLKQIENTRQKLSISQNQKPEIKPEDLLDVKEKAYLQKLFPSYSSTGTEENKKHVKTGSIIDIRI